MSDDKSKVEEVAASESPKEPVIPAGEETPEEETVEVTPEVPEETETPEEPETVEEEIKEEEPKPPSRRETLRIQDLLKKYGPPKDRVPYQPRQDVMDYKETLNAEPDLIEQLELDRRTAAESGYNAGIKRAEFLDWRTSVKIDNPIVKQKYPMLDPASPQFHPAVADSVNTWYMKMTGGDPETETVVNPNISYAEFVDGFMELVQEAAGQKNAQTVKNVARQAAATGLRPDGSSAKRLNLNKAPEDMSIEELYAVIGQSMPKKKIK